MSDSDTDNPLGPLFKTVFIVKKNQPKRRHKSKEQTIPSKAQRAISHSTAKNELFSDLEEGYTSARQACLNILSSKNHATEAQCWLDTSNSKIQEINKAREQWDTKARKYASIVSMCKVQSSDQIKGEDERWRSILAPKDYTHGSRRIMNQQIHRLRLLCAEAMVPVAKDPLLVQKVYPSKSARNETYDDRVERVLEDVYDQYISAHDKMCREQWGSAEQ